jgi:hypothetical protein
MALALIEFYVTNTINGQAFELDPLLDQRACNIGNSATFVKVMNLWINQEEPRWKRQQYKNKVSKIITGMDSATDPVASSLLEEARTFYQMHTAEIDYALLKEIYQN